LLPTLATLEALAPRLTRVPRPPERVRARGQRRAVVGMLTGCVQSAFFPDVNSATVRILAAEGCDVLIPSQQGCCGALSVHNGREAEAQRFARKLIDTFEGSGMDYFVVNAAGCGSSLKEYGILLRDDPAYAERAAAFAAKVRDLSEVLTELGPVAERHPLPITIAYHDACHLGHAQGVRAQPRRLLRDIPGLEVVDPEDWEICCGSAGLYNILQVGAAEELGRRKAENLLATGAEAIAAANPGCILQIAAHLEALGHPLPVYHPIELLSMSLSGRRTEAAVEG
jgi:glycolate oxidase iron-sulfur subunit